MGTAFSSTPTAGRYAESVMSESESSIDAATSEVMEAEEEKAFRETEDEEHDDETRAKAKEEEMNEFRKQLDIKREQRKEILARHRTEKEDLEKSLHRERISKLELYEKNQQLRELLTSNNIEIPDNLKSSNEIAELSDAVIQLRDEFESLKVLNNKLRRDLAESNNSLQNAYSDIADLNVQNTESIKQISALKEVVTISKTMINLREDQLKELKLKLYDIEKTLADRETSLLSADLRQEYERQLLNIRTLRGLYEERARLAEVTRQGLVRDLEEQKLLYQAETNKCKNLTSKIEELELKVSALEDTVDNKNSEISTCQDEKDGLKAEMAVVNKLFSQVLLGYKTKQDLDKLVHRLEENHGLLTHMAERENGSELSSAMPKMLLELVSQVDDHEDHNINEEKQEQDDVDAFENNGEVVNGADIQSGQNTTAEEIVENLPKVWRVLMELLSHQTVAEPSTEEKVTTCYKSVETKSGPVLVPSVSQTYIRLKDLIIEKLGLVKEVNRMKQLNSHLESRLEEQERRLCLVTTELSKTWHVVSRLRKHHSQLHTHEKILKYELQQKRKLLNELKEELEYCREKWEQAREKNTQSERDWRKLRAEFSSRKPKSNSPSLNNSAESGYSDERASDESSDSNDESEYVAEPLIRSKKKSKKSFETILDSSADINLAAEREDPVSDMLDVADLPLDTQDGDGNHNFTPEIPKSEINDKYAKMCEETEDESCEISHDDSCTEDIVHETDNAGTTSENDIKSVSISKSAQEIPYDGCIINPAEILRNIQKQNERLAEKDKKLARLEKCSAGLITKTQATLRLGNEINSTLDLLLERPSSSNRTVQFNEQDHEHLTNPQITCHQSADTTSNIVDKNQSDEPGMPRTNSKTLHNTAHSKSENAMNDQKNYETDPKVTLENDNRNERLSIETDNNSIISDDKKIDDPQELSHLNREEDSESTPSFSEESNSTVKENLSEPSTSSEIDHEARFAARDLRLKRLEEQTKSLVKKVNKTTSKGVKINYKLEELHNIYGSENSRAGTPSEDDEKSEKTNGDESNCEQD